MVSGQSWQWSKAMTTDGVYMEINNATTTAYTPMDADDGHYLKATVMYTDGHGSGKSAMKKTTSMVTAAADARDPLLVRYDTNNNGIEKSPRS